jgi:diguanylate cyclase (GGDEF)-like protein/PAS domain S-box-containing protein
MSSPSHFGRQPAAARPRRVLLLSAMALVAFAAMTALHTGDSGMWTSAESLAEALAATVAAIACLERIKRERHARELDPSGSARYVWAWSLIALGVVAWATGQFGWTMVEGVVGLTATQVSALDVAFIAFPVLVAIGLLSTVRTPAGSLSPLRAVLEGLFIASGFLLLSWSLVVSAAIGGIRLPALNHAVNLAYPALDAVAISAAMFVVLRIRRNSPPGVGLLAAGVACIAFSDLAFWYLTATNPGYPRVSTVGTGWLGGFVLISLGALWLRTPTRRIPLAERRWVPLLPAVPAGAGVVAMVLRWHHLSAGQQPTLLAISVCVLALAVLLGLVVAYENRALTGDLERRVRQRTTQLAAAEGHFRALVENSSDVIMVLDADRRITYVSDSVWKVFGFRPTQLCGRTADVFGEVADAALEDALARASAAPATTVTIAWELLDCTGRRRHAESVVTNLLHEPNVEGLVLNTRDHTDEVELQAQLRTRSLHDSLCGVANRPLLEERVGQALEHTRGSGESVALAAVAIDRFTAVNDRHGHKVGDELLRQLARRLQRVVRPGDTVARLGGDEFLVLMDPVSGAQEACERAALVRKAVIAPGLGGEHHLALTASIGVALATSGRGTFEQLANDADMAMRSVKAGGKDAVALFSSSMHRRARERAGMQADLAKALRREELWLLYQPRFALADGCLDAFEVSVRWNHPRLGLLHADRFATLLEKSGLGVQFGRWVLAQALSEIGACQPVCDRQRLVSVAVKLSSVHLEAPGLVGHVGEAIARSGVEPGRLTLEIPERALLEGLRHHAEVLASLKQLGVMICIDAFGGGSVAAAALAGLPVDLLRIDPALVRAAAAGRPGQEVLSALIENAHRGARATLADGVELPPQLAVVHNLGCDLAQGPLLGVSLAIEEARRLASEDFSLAEATGSAQMLPGLARAVPLRVRQSSGS